MFSLFDSLLGLDGLGSWNGSVSSWMLSLLGEVGNCCFGPLFVEPMVGISFMALEKTSGRSKAPGGACLLLGLPCGVCAGEMKASFSAWNIVSRRARDLECFNDHPTWKRRGEMGCGVIATMVLTE